MLITMNVFKVAENPELNSFVPATGCQEFHRAQFYVSKIFIEWDKMKKYGFMYIDQLWRIQK